MRPQRILVICPTGTFDNGAEKAMYHAMRLFVSRGHHVVAVSPKQPFQSQYREKFEAIGVKIHTLPVLNWWWQEAQVKTIGTSAMRQAAETVVVEQIKKLVTVYDSDVVLTNTVHVPHGAVAAKQCGVPHMWLIHEFPEDEFAYYRDKYAQITQLSTQIFSVSGALQSYLEQEGLAVKPFVPFTQVTGNVLPAVAQQRLVQVGFVSERKNQMALLELKRRLPEELPVVFIGDWQVDYKKRCDDYIAKYQLKNVLFLGYCENPWEKVYASDVCVFPSKKETFGLVYAEAVLLGLTSVLSDNPGHLSAHAVFGKGLVYQLGNSEDFFNKVKQALQIRPMTTLDRFSYSLEEAYQDLVRAIEVLPKQDKAVIYQKQTWQTAIYGMLNQVVWALIFGGKWLKRKWGK